MVGQLPKYLTGDPAAINEFIDQFDVRLSLYNYMAILPLTFPSDIPL